MKRLGIAALAAGIVLWGSTARADEYDDIGPLPPLADGSAPAAAPSAAPAAKPPAADASAPDSVTLRNQTWYRGRVTEIVPSDHVTIVLPTGEAKRVAWNDIEKVVVSSHGPPSPPSAPAASAGEPPMTGPMVRVHVTSPRTANLYRRPRGTSSWHLACASPCDRQLPLEDDYRVAVTGGSGVKEFRLHGAPGSTVNVDVSPPSVLGMIAGGGLAGTGATGMYVGSVLTLVGAATAGQSCTSPYNRAQCQRDADAGPAIRNAGLVTLAVSTLMTAGGVWLFVASATTDVSTTSSSPADAHLRSPVWRAPSSAEVATGAPATFPLVLTKTF